MLTSASLISVFASLDAGEVEEVVDHLGEVLGGAEDELDLLVLLVR